MQKVVIIADDLTGANATGVLLARKGYRTATFLRLEAYTPEKYRDYSVIAINTDSRAIAAQEAYRRVAATVKAMAGPDTALFSKRIDSTLRGNLGPETDAVLDQLGPDYVAIVVAAFPASGRVTIGGYLMVNSVPLERTDVARDPKTPVTKSVVTELIAGQSKYPVGHVPLDTVLGKAQSVRDALLAQQRQGKRIVVVDATTEEDLQVIAEAVHSSGIKAVAVDPGPFTEALAKQFIPKPSSERGRKVLLVVGSVTPLTRAQLKDVEHRYDCAFVYADARALASSAKAGQEIEKVAAELWQEAAAHEVSAVRTVKGDQDVLKLADLARSEGISEEEVAERIAAGLAQIAKEVLERSRGVLGALYTSGGDVTVAVCRELNAVAIEVKDEVLPLAAYGRVIGGSHEELPIITKGGLVGGNDAISRCIEYLLTKVSTEASPTNV